MPRMTITPAHRDSSTRSPGSALPTASARTPSAAPGVLLRVCGLTLSLSLGLGMMPGILGASALGQQTDPAPPPIQEQAKEQPQSDEEKAAAAAQQAPITQTPLPTPGTRTAPATVVRPGAVTATRAQPAGNQPAGNQPAGSQRGGGQPVNQPANQAGNQPAAGVEPEIPAEGPVSFDAFSEPVDLTTLVDYIAKSLGINITIKGTLQGQVVFNAPVEVERDRLLGLLSSMLEQHNYALLYDQESTFYSIISTNEMGLRLGDQFASTRVFTTPNVRPSALKQLIDAQLTGAAAGGGVSNRVSAVDELGVLVVTETPRKLDQIGKLIDEMLEKYAKNQFTRIELRHIAAPAARERALQLVGQLAQQRGGQGGIPDGSVAIQPVPGQVGGMNIRLDNIGDRLTVDAQSNSLVFRGLPEEIEQVRSIISVIDMKNNLVPSTYFVGGAAKQIADLARNRGLGEVVTISTRGQDSSLGNFFGGDPSQFQNQFQRQASNVGGPVMVVDEGTGRIFYYGTEEQQVELKDLIEKLDIQAEQVVIRGYKLKHGDAETMAELILSLIQNRSPEGEGSPLLSSGGGFQQPQRPTFDFFPQPGAQNPTEEGGLSLNSRDVFVVADKSNNQLMVKAPLKQQREFERLIDSLDLRRPQVYVEAIIVAVTADDDLRLAFETQLINAGGTGGVLNTNFGLSSFGQNGQLTNRKNPVVGLTGLTAAVIKSDQVPIILNALKRETNSRIVSTPQLLANDNEEAEVVSINTQPIPSISRGTGGSGDVITSSGDAEAGTKLKVTPQISEGGYLKLEYDIELSSFTGEPTDNLPPPTQKNNIKSTVTVPSDSTIVVGGLVLNSQTKTVAKIPLIGDIPILGALFSDQTKGNTTTTLYIFLRPRIFRDAYFADAKLNTLGPAATSKLPDDLPAIKPTFIEIVEKDRNRK